MPRLAVLLFAFALAACAPERSDPSAGNEVRRADAAFHQARVAGGADLLKSIYAADADGISFGEREERDAMIAADDKDVDFQTGVSDDVRVRMLGPDAALVTGQVKGTFRYPDSEDRAAFPFQERFSHLWVRQADGWRLAHRHVSEPQP